MVVKKLLHTVECLDDDCLHRVWNETVVSQFTFQEFGKFEGKRDICQDILHSEEIISENL
jgi:hypothetical protein